MVLDFWIGTILYNFGRQNISPIRCKSVIKNDFSRESGTNMF